MIGVDEVEFGTHFIEPVEPDVASKRLLSTAMRTRPGGRARCGGVGTFDAGGAHEFMAATAHDRGC